MAARQAGPFVKWAGGKRQLLGELGKRYPAGLGDTITRYAEPFVGGGAVLFDVLGKYCIKEAYISDANAQLINTYRQVRDNPQGLITVLSALETEYLSLDKEGRKALYLRRRENYNELLKAGTASEGTDAAALFLFLNRTCFNGLYRVNRAGLFNTPAGEYKNPCICNRENILAASAALQGTQIICGDFSPVESFADDKTFVYLDPPYRPLPGKAGNFTAYTGGGFDDAEQERLAECALRMADKGAYVMASNADTGDGFFERIYAGMKAEHVTARRAISSDGNTRSGAGEIIIISR